MGCAVAQAKFNDALSNCAMLNTLALNKSNPGSSVSLNDVKKLEDAQSTASRRGVSKICKASFDELTADQEIASAASAKEEFDRHLTDIAEKIRKLREQDQKLTRLVEERRSRSAEYRSGSSFASVDALQNAALGESDDGCARRWLVGDTGLEKQQTGGADR